MPSKCKFEKCTNIGVFNYLKETGRIYCKEHKKDGMVNKRIKYCLTCVGKKEEGLNSDGLIGACFGFKGGEREYCNNHKKEGMVNLKSKLCLECDTQACFGTKGGKIEYCKKHKKEGMERIKNKKTCLKCDKQPSFNLPNKKGGIYCTAHKLKDMVDVVSKSSKLCSHGKTSCKECKHRYCEHDRYKYTCPDCNGDSMCKHKKPRYRCKECDGGAYCKHKKRYDRCRECGKEKGLCLNCNDKWGNPIYDKYCTICFYILFPDDQRSKDMIGKPYTYDEVKEKLKLKGFELLSKTYKNNNTDLEYKCSNGHVNTGKLRGILVNVGCPSCFFKNEARCKEIMENYFGVNFIKTRPEWLDGLELDGYNEDLQIAFEYNGKQHYDHVEFFHKYLEDFENQKIRDRRKHKICGEKCIHLLAIPYTIDYENLEPFIINHFESIFTVPDLD